MIHPAQPTVSERLLQDIRTGPARGETFPEHLPSLLSQSTRLVPQSGLALVLAQMRFALSKEDPIMLEEQSCLLESLSQQSVRFRA